MAWVETLMLVLDYLLWVFVTVVVILVGFWVWQVKSFKHKFRVREVTKNRRIIIDDVAREVKDKDGNLWWQLKKMKEKVPTPPPEAIEIDKKGRKCVEAYRVAPEQYFYIEDKAGDKFNDVDAVKTFDILTTNQRSLLVKSIRDSLNRKKRSLADQITTIASISSLTIIVVVLFVFWGDIAKPALELNKEQAIISEQQSEMMERMNTMQEVNYRMIKELNDVFDHYNVEVVEPPN